MTAISIATYICDDGIWVDGVGERARPTLVVRLVGNSGEGQKVHALGIPRRCGRRQQGGDICKDREDLVTDAVGELRLVGKAASKERLACLDGRTGRQRSLRCSTIVKGCWRFDGQRIDVGGCGGAEEGREGNADSQTVGQC